MSEFKKRIYEIVKIIPSGKVASYGQVALMSGVPRGARQVGWVLHDADEANKLPWWRVINNAGRISTKCEEHTAQIQQEMLESEGVVVKKLFKIDIEKYRYRPNPTILKRLKLDDKYIYTLIEKYGV